MRGALAAAVIVALLAAAPVLAASDTWGYGYGRTRVTTAPIAEEALAVPGDAAGNLGPFVVPLPGKSQSTPVVAGDRWYLWTYWDQGLRGALWSGRLNPASATSSAGRAVDLPGQPTAVLAAVPGADFAEPSDAAISPDGAWVAFAAGDRLYWWPTGHPGRGGSTLIPGPEPLAADGTSPTFVADASVPSGWAVCDGDWDGGFACYAAAPATGTAPLELAGYATVWGGLPPAPITSSAAVGPGGVLYFGVASARVPRLVAVHLDSGAATVLAGPPVVRAPIWAATAFSQGVVFATDVEGNIYQVPGAGGRTQVVRSGSGPLIEPPTVTAHHVLLTSPTRDALFVADRNGTGAAWLPLGSVPGALGTPTLAVDTGVRAEVLFTHGGGGLASDAVSRTWGALAGLFSAPEVQPPRDPFTAAVLSGPTVLVWDDAATATARRRAPPPAGGRPTPGGLEVFGLVPRLTAMVSPSTVSVGSGAAVVRLLAPIGASLSVGGPDGPLNPEPESAAGAEVCSAAWRGLAPNVGAFPGTGGGAPTGGCGPESGGAATWTRRLSAASTAPLADAAGTPPSQWAAAGARFLAWEARVPGPAAVGPQAVTVTARMSDGRATTLRLWLEATCATGRVASVGGSCTLAGQPVAPSPGGCALGPSVSVAERRLLCGVHAPWLSDARLATCWEPWWARVVGSPANCASKAGGGP